MPNRMIREGFLDSTAIHALGDAAECFYHRLLLAADDAGRFDGRVEILRARLFPLDTSRRVSDVEKSLTLCVKEGLVIPYTWDGRPYLQLTKVYRSSPATTSKFPWKDGSFRFSYVKRETRDGEKEFVATSIPSASHSDGMGMGCDPLCPQPPVYEDVYEDEDDKSARPAPVDLFPDVTEQTVKDFKALRKAKKAPITETAMDGIKREAAKAGYTLEQALRTICERGWTGFKADWVANAPGPMRPSNGTVRTRRELA